MDERKSQPMPKEAVIFLDQQLAQFYLLRRLLEIPEFVQLWGQARELPGKIVEVVKPRLLNRFAVMSPAGRGAAVSPLPVFLLYDQKARTEATEALADLETATAAVHEILEEHGIKVEYRAELEVLMKPLGVPGLVDVMVVWDAQQWGIDRVISDSGPIEGPLRDYLELEVSKYLTDLGPSGLAKETPGRIRRRIERKVSPLSQHLKRYDLANRIDLWVLNVVHGFTYEEIASALQQDESRLATGWSPYQWVRKQVRDASHVLGVKRKGRPLKGGVLRQWKLMSK